MTAVTVDTSVLVAALSANHEHHGLAWPAVERADVLVSTCLAEVWSVLSRGVFSLPTAVVSDAVAMLLDRGAPVVAPSTDDTVGVLRSGVRLGLGGNVHDAVVAATCASNDLDLITLDRRQAMVARAMGVDALWLLSDA